MREDLVDTTLRDCRHDDRRGEYLEVGRGDVDLKEEADRVSRTRRVSRGYLCSGRL